jgi:hypothetical protein
MKFKAVMTDYLDKSDDDCHQLWSESEDDDNEM